MNWTLDPATCRRVAESIAAKLFDDEFSYGSDRMILMSDRGAVGQFTRKEFTDHVTGLLIEEQRIAAAGGK